VSPICSHQLAAHKHIHTYIILTFRMQTAFIKGAICAHTQIIKYRFNWPPGAVNYIERVSECRRRSQKHQAAQWGCLTPIEKQLPRYIHCIHRHTQWVHLESSLCCVCVYRMKKLAQKEASPKFTQQVWQKKYIQSVLETKRQPRADYWLLTAAAPLKGAVCSRFWTQQAKRT